MKESLGRRCPVPRALLCFASLSLSLSCLSSLIGCAPVAARSRSSAEESAAFPYSAKTVLYYDTSHGNQVEYYDPAGRAFLWYPTNRIALGGEWRMDQGDVCFRYDNSYNPVTGDYGDDWDCRPLERLSTHIVDVAEGDVFRLSTEHIPYRLPAHPRFSSVADVKPAP